MTQETMVHGIDVVDLDDFSRLLSPQMESELHRLFTPGELDAVGNGGLRAERLAGRFAVKEAVMKALSSGFGDGVAFLDIETVNEVNGAPRVRLHGRMQAEAERLLVTDWLVSTSHAGRVVFASVIGVQRS